MMTGNNGEKVMVALWWSLLMSTSTFAFWEAREKAVIAILVYISTYAASFYDLSFILYWAYFLF